MARHQHADGQAEDIGEDHGEKAHDERCADHGRLALLGLVVCVVVGEFLHVHSVKNGLIFERAENDARLRLVPGLKGNRAFNFRTLRLEKHLEHVQSLIGRIGGSEVHGNDVLVDEREAAVGIQQIFVRSTAADERQAAGGRRAEAQAALKIGVCFILHRPGRVDHEQVTEPARHALDDRDILIGIITPAFKVVGDGVALRGIILHEVPALRGVRFDGSDHFGAAGFVEREAIVIDADIVQIAEFFPGRVNVFGFVVGFAAELAVGAVLKEDVVARDHRVDHRENDEHDDEDGNDRAQQTLPDIAFSHRRYRSLQ